MYIGVVKVHFVLHIVAKLDLLGPPIDDELNKDGHSDNIGARALGVTERSKLCCC